MCVVGEERGGANDWLIGCFRFNGHLGESLSNRLPETGKYTTQTLLRITFTMSCQHFHPERIVKFLVYQCWKLIQRCCLKVLLFSQSPFFQSMHKSMGTLKICHSRNMSRWS